MRAALGAATSHPLADIGSYCKSGSYLGNDECHEHIPDEGDPEEAPRLVRGYEYTYRTCNTRKKKNRASAY